MAPYHVVLLLVLLFPMIKTLAFCALSYLQHSYTPFSMLETVWFSIFIPGSCSTSKGQEGSFCSSKNNTSFFVLLPVAAIFIYLEKSAKWQCTYKSFELKTILQPEILGLQTIIWNLGISYLLSSRVSQHSSKSIHFCPFITRITCEELIGCPRLKSNR